MAPLPDIPLSQEPKGVALRAVLWVGLLNAIVVVSGLLLWMRGFVVMDPWVFVACLLSFMLPLSLAMILYHVQKN